jgi:hypothetical protein
MNIVLKKCVSQGMALEDKTSLMKKRHDNIKIARMVKDRFPYPYMNGCG